jgi:hypothetical protein
MLVPFWNRLPLADGSITQADRQQTAWAYSGILAQAPSVFTPPVYNGGNLTLTQLITNTANIVQLWTKTIRID